MFDKLIRKGKQMAGEYVREQLNQRSDDGRRDGVRGDGRGQQPRRDATSAGRGGVAAEDRAAIAKYHYMLKTAPPEDMERAHAEAFSRLTPQQRALLQTELAEQLPAAERPATDRPQDLARAATRGEVSRPGFMEKVLGRSGSGRSSMGGMAAGGLGAGLLGGVAGAFIGTAIAGPLLDGFSGVGEDLAGAAEGLTDGVSGVGEEISAAGEGLADQSGGIIGDFFGGGGEFGGFGGDGGGFGDFEL